MSTALFTAYVLWWTFTYGMRWSSRTMFWWSWMVDVSVLILATNPILSRSTPLGIHCVLGIIGASSPLFLAQCHTSPFRD